MFMYSKRNTNKIQESNHRESLQEYWITPYFSIPVIKSRIVGVFDHLYEMELTLATGKKVKVYTSSASEYGAA